MNLCKDCKWLVGVSGPMAQCVAPKNPKSTDPVTGEVIFDYTLCSVHRTLRALGVDQKPQPEFCGIEGRWFEKKDTQ